jgi:hypothetical protein
MQWLVWLAWLTIMIVGNVVFMNFIIAVVNESYTNSMAKQKTQSFRLKVPRIVECESKLKDKTIKHFPSYIIVKKSSNLVNEDSSEEQAKLFKDFQIQIKRLA